MKKMILALLSLVVISMFLIGCAKSGEEDIAGQAVKIGGKIVRLDCKQLGNFDDLAHPNTFCKSQGYDACVHGEIVAHIPNGDLNMLVTIPLLCNGYDYLNKQQNVPSDGTVTQISGGSNSIDINDPDAIINFFVKENTGYEGPLSETDVLVTCCRVR